MVRSSWPIARNMVNSQTPNAVPMMPPASSMKASGKAGKKGETLTVRGPIDGRWRGGLWFGPTDITVDLSTITAAQLAAIESDKVLSVKRS